MPRVKTYTKFLRVDGLKNKRIGIVRYVSDIDTFYDMPPSIIKKIKESLIRMKNLGATFIDLKLSKFNNNRNNNQAGEVEDVNEYLMSFPSTRKNFKDICKSNRTRTFGTTEECLHFIQNIDRKGSKLYQEAISIFKQNKTYIHQVMEKQHLDALLIPITTNGTATYDGMTVNTWRAPVSSNSGLPSININVNYSDDGMPIGIELVGKQFQEGILIEMVYAYEQASPLRRNPIMPDKSEQLEDLSIPELNNLFTLLGSRSYQEVLINNKKTIKGAHKLTAEKFREITIKLMKDMINLHKSKF